MRVKSTRQGYAKARPWGRKAAPPVYQETAADKWSYTPGKTGLVRLCTMTVQVDNTRESAEFYTTDPSVSRHEEFYD